MRVLSIIPALLITALGSGSLAASEHVGRGHDCDPHAGCSYGHHHVAPVTRCRDDDRDCGYGHHSAAPAPRCRDDDRDCRPAPCQEGRYRDDGHGSGGGGVAISVPIPIPVPVPLPFFPFFHHH
jgi:hypothetical protein